MLWSQSSQPHFKDGSAYRQKSPSAPGNPGCKSGCGGPGQRFGRRSQLAIALSRYAAQLLGAEAAARSERHLTTGITLAHLPFQRTLVQFDFGFQPSIGERPVKELANLAFVSEASNIVLLETPGVGKTYLAIALALQPIENEYRAYFVQAYDLMEDLRKARAEHNLERCGAASLELGGHSPGSGR